MDPYIYIYIYIYLGPWNSTRNSMWNSTRNSMWNSTGNFICGSPHGSLWIHMSVFQIICWEFCNKNDHCAGGAKNPAPVEWQSVKLYTLWLQLLSRKLIDPCPGHNMIWGQQPKERTPAGRNPAHPRQRRRGETSAGGAKTMFYRCHFAQDENAGGAKQVPT